MAMPEATGLFQRAILQSIVEGGELPTRAPYEQGTGAAVTAAVGCAGGNAEIAACLRALPASTLVSAVPGKIDVFPRIYSPIVDDRILKASPIDAIDARGHVHVAVMQGSNTDETAQQASQIGALPDEAAYRAAIAKVFGARADRVVAHYPPGADPRAAFVAATTDALHLCPARRFLHTLAGAQDQPVYRYLYAHAFEGDPALRAAGASHIFELPYLFHFRNAKYKPSAAELALSEQMIGYWVRFATTGDPNGDGAPTWPTLTRAADRFLRLDVSIAADAGVRTQACDFWDSP
jgi:para-nitrobenzyl esterase